MLNNINLDDKTFEELYEDALQHIPLYSKEWTNFNVSDPGITIIENLTSYSLMQQGAINLVSDAVKLKLLKMVGYTPLKDKCSRVMLGDENSVYQGKIPAHQKFYVGNTCFEAENEIFVDNGKILGVFAGNVDLKNEITGAGTEESAIESKRKFNKKDVGFLANRNIPLSYDIFTENPKKNMYMDILFSKMPRVGENLRMYISLDEKYRRNPISDAQAELLNSRVKWQLYTVDGFVDVPQYMIEDKTRGLLLSGSVQINIPAMDIVKLDYIVDENIDNGMENAIENETENETNTGDENMPDGNVEINNEEIDYIGDAAEDENRDNTINAYVLRMVLEDPEYDIPPRMSSIDAYLYKFLQMDSRALIYEYRGGREVNLVGELSDEHRMVVYCREENEEYRIYTEVDFYMPEDEFATGRYYKKIRQGINDYLIIFPDKEKYQNAFAPIKDKISVAIVCYSEDMANKRLLGKIYGYDNQVVDIGLNNVYGNNFRLIVQYLDENNEQAYDFVKPGLTGDDDLCYQLVSDNTRLLITSCGKYESAVIYIGQISFFEAENGNVIENNQFVNNKYPYLSFYNPAKGYGGRRREDINAIRKRFSHDLQNPINAVTTTDFEKIVLETPGLCIHKVKAIKSNKKNEVKIVVKPCGEQRVMLSDVYEKQIYKYIDERRMITTRVEIASPEYLPIHVTCVVYAKKHAVNCYDRIMELIENRLDYVTTDRAFGEVVRYSDLFRAIEMMEGVEYVYSLSLQPGKMNLVTMAGSDIVLGQDCLCYAGKINLEINTV